MLVSEFGFELPEELIAQRPPEVRGASRMLRLDRRTGTWEDGWFGELPSLLSPGDLLVLNDTRVLPARLFATRAGVRAQAGSPVPAGVVEVLLTEQMDAGVGENVWRALVKPAKKVPVGEQLLFAAVPGEDPVLRAEVVAAGEFGERTIRFSTPANTFAGDPAVEPLQRFHTVLARIGHLPLPPYIRRDKAERNTEEDRERYQTVYSRPFVALRVGHAGGEQQVPRAGNDKQERREQSQVQVPGRAGQQFPRAGNDKQERREQLQVQVPGRAGQQVPRAGIDEQGRQVQVEGRELVGSAAAPTAGLHFTPEVLAELEERGVEVARVTLHVGLGTFQPVRVERTENIRLHAEPYTLSAATAEALNRAWAQGRRIVAVGTTTTRTLEHVARRFEAEFGALSAANPLRLEAHSGSTGLFLSPGPDGDDQFKLVGGLLTNFHLPQSTLLMLVSAFAGRERTLAAYRHAVEAGYRFFSYGDCMLLL